MQEYISGLAARFSKASYVNAVIGIVMGLTGMTGWILNSEALKSFFTGQSIMKINSGVCLVLSGTSLLLLHHKQVKWAQLMVVLVLGIALGSLAENLFQINLGIDQLLLPSRYTATQISTHFGRVPPFTSTNLALMAFSILLLSRKAYFPAQTMATLLVLVEYATLLGRLMDASGYYQLPNFTSIGLHTVIGLLALSSGIVLYEPRRGWITILSSRYMGGTVARNLLAYITLITPFLMLFYLYVVDNRNLPHTTGILSFVFMTALITLPLAYLLLHRLDKLSAQLYQTNQELQNTNASLLVRNQEMEHLTKHLEKSHWEGVQKNEELERINRDLDSLLYMVTHDLKGPISNLMGLLPQVEKILPPELSPRDVRLVEMVKLSVVRLQATIDEIAQVIKAQKEVQEIKECLSIQQILEEVKTTLDKQIQEANAHIQLDLQVDQITVAPIHLKSILTNLLSNALKYRSKDRALEVQITARRLDGGVQMKVRDNGLGIPAKHVPQLFTLFKRFHHQVEGSGMGLYLVKSIMENNGGRIEVESQEGQGTQFTLFFPNQREA